MGDPEAIERAWRGYDQAQRQEWTNQRGGYSIYTGASSALDRARHRQVEMVAGERILLYSDGFARLFDFDLASGPSEFIEGGLEAGYEKLRAGRREIGKGGSGSDSGSLMMLLVE